MKNFGSFITGIIVIALAILILSRAGCNMLTLRSQLQETGLFGQIAPDKYEIANDGVTIYWKNGQGEEIKATLPKDRLPKLPKNNFFVKLIFNQEIENPTNGYLQGYQKKDLTTYIQKYCIEIIILEK